MKYIDLLNNGYSFYKEKGDVQSKKEYLSDYIFDFITYDSGMSELFAEKAIEVCKAINDRKTFDYIKDSECYKWFLIMCNTGFFVDKLNWGTSIRGAWWDYKITFGSCGLFNNDGKQLYEEMNFTDSEWREFISAIVEFADKKL